MMKISLDEQEAIRQVLVLGAAHGYGNLIAHLQTAWAAALMKDSSLPEFVARGIACHRGTAGYPFAMQRDLLERGEWDETGARYRLPSPALRFRPHEN